jgi:hypothetical protein
MFYHIAIERNWKAPEISNTNLYEFDKVSLSDIKNKALIPYLLGQTFVFSGSFISKQDIVRVRVYGSKWPIEDYFQMANEESINNVTAAMVLSDRENIDEITSDVLDDVLNAYDPGDSMEDIYIPELETMALRYVLLDRIGIIEFLKESQELASKPRQSEIALLSAILGFGSDKMATVKQWTTYRATKHKNNPLTPKNIAKVDGMIIQLGLKTRER